MQKKILRKLWKKSVGIGVSMTVLISLLPLESVPAAALCTLYGGQ